MKTSFKTIIGLAALTLALGACHKSNNDTVTPAVDPNTGVTFSVTGDQVGRPGIATVFISAADKDNFNATLPSVMSAAYLTKIQNQLQAYNGNAYVSNILGLNAAAFSGVLATDVLNVSTNGTTTYYDGVAANTLSGRKLTDDVIDVSLILVFGGPTNSANPGLTSDHVNANDKTFLTTFPYEANPW